MEFWLRRAGDGFRPVQTVKPTYSTTPNARQPRRQLPCATIFTKTLRAEYLSLQSASAMTKTPENSPVSTDPRSAYRYDNITMWVRVGPRRRPIDRVMAEYTRWHRPLHSLQLRQISQPRFTADSPSAAASAAS